MVRKVSMLVCTLALIFGCAMTAQAATHEIYDGSVSSTYITYFKDTLSGLPLGTNYVCFRSGQNEYVMIAGDVVFNGSQFVLDGEAKEYRYYSDSSSYNSYYHYDVSEIAEFQLEVGNHIVYSDLGEYPQLMDRGEKYEVLSAVLISICMLSIVINRIFRGCLRR